MGAFTLTCRRLSNKRHTLANAAFRLQRSDDRPSLIELKPLSATNQAALAHFDKYYTQIYGPSGWSAIRAALLCPPAKVAVLNRFCTRFHNLNRFKGYVDLIEQLSEHVTTQSNVSTLGAQRDAVAAEETESSPDENVVNEAISVRINEVPTVPEPQPRQHEPEAIVSRRQLLGRDQFGSLDPNNLSEFVPVTELISESDIYTRPVDDEFTFDSPQGVHRSPDQPALTILPDSIRLPENLRVMCSRRSRTQYLDSPRYADGQFDFYPIDLASIVPVLALNLEPGDSLLDMCAAPGGKSVVALQTMQLDRLLCVDNSLSRLDRLQQVLQTYGPVDMPASPNISVVHESQLSDFIRTELRNQSSKATSDERLFSKVLVDVPCSTDRHALSSDLGSVFSRGRMKARLALPATQSNLLRRAMSLCRPGGTVVYATCTLSPAQNQIVVESCLRQVNQTDGDVRFALVDPRPLVRLFHAVESVLGLRMVTVPSSSDHEDTPVGLLVVPALSANYGPAFVAKLQRLS